MLNALRLASSAVGSKKDALSKCGFVFVLSRTPFPQFGRHRKQSNEQIIAPRIGYLGLEVDKISSGNRE